MSSESLIKSAVNFHFTRVCNYECKFCFHSKKTTHVLSIEKQFAILKLLRNAGAEKINFAGGEPFLYPDILGKMVKEAKSIGYSSVSVITNGSRVKKGWFEKYGRNLDILGVSCDSQNPRINFEHGRKIAGSAFPRDDTKKIRECAAIARAFGIHFKVNTVVTSKNKHEDMSAFINELSPMRWKIFKVLDVEGENCNKGMEGDLSNLLITENEFAKYIERNMKGLDNKKILVAETNEIMRSSYILVDEFGRFLDASTGSKIPTRSILEVGCDAALRELNSSEGGGFNRRLFEKRGGYYPESWSRNLI